MIIDVQLQLQQVKDVWDGITSLPAEFSSLGFPELTKVDVSDALGGAITILDELSNKDDFKPSLVSIFNLRQAVASLSTYATSHVPTNPAPHLPEMLRLLGVVGAAVNDWLEESENTAKRATASQLQKLAEANSKLQDATEVRKKLNTYHDQIVRYAEVAGEQAADLTKIVDQTTALREVITVNSVSSAKHLKMAEDDANKIGDLTTELLGLKDELLENKANQQSMFVQFEGYRDTIKDLLGDANRAGMAASFKARKGELRNPMGWWLALFVFSILCIVVMGIFYFAPILENGKLEQLPFRLALVSPLIWLGWFSAKHYGYTARLREDYAFKEAAAMSFEGYKREANKSTVEMQDKLLDLAINNFSDNPLRIYSANGNHGSPLHEAVDRVRNNLQ